MIVECPQCHSNFKVDAALLTREGRDVRCTQCSFVWKQKPNKDHERMQADENVTSHLDSHDETHEPVPESVKIKSDEGGVPSISEDLETGKRQAINHAAIALLLLCVLGIVFLFFAKETVMQRYPGSVVFYDTIGLYHGHPYSGFKIEKTLSEIRRDGETRYLYVEANITNISNEALPYPPVKIMVLENGIVLKEWFLEQRDKMLSVGQMEEISVGLPNVPEAAVTTIITIEKKVKDD